MTSSLSTIPVDRRRRAAVTLGLFVALFLAVGIVSFVGHTSAVVRGLGVVALLAAAVQGLIVWGLVHSIRLDGAGAELDAVIGQALAEHGGMSCGCGHDHDVSEMQVVEACEHDGEGTDCAHDCGSCELRGLVREQS